MIKTYPKLIFSLMLVPSLVTLFFARPVQAQWPPFNFNMTPSYADGRITYQITLANRVDWTMTDITVKIPLPPGTRFLEANTPATTTVDFDGQDITFFTATFHRPIRDISFVVEVTDPTTVFTTHAWIAWQGDHPDHYLTRDVSFDITRQPLNWSAPRSALQLDVKATVAGDNTITYNIYPKNVNSRRMWDLKINIPIPEGTTFLEAGALPPFVASFDGREVSFTIIELEREIEVSPLTFKVSTTPAVSPFIVTRAWASWKNVRGLQAETVTGDIVVQPTAFGQVVVADAVADVPMSNYDVTSISTQVDGDSLKVAFYLAGEVGPVNEPREYLFYIDQDCSTASGLLQRGLGADYVLRYRHNVGRADLGAWDNAGEKWGKRVRINSLAGGKMVAVWIPLDLFENSPQFCWVGQARNNSKAFTPNPPADWAPGRSDLRLTRYELAQFSPGTNPPENVVPEVVPVLASEPQNKYIIPFGETWQYLKGYGEASYPGTAWQQVNYNDTGWFSGLTGIGYGAGDAATVLNDMRHNYVSIYMRHKFNIPAPDQIRTLSFEIDYSDGFVAYLNGTEVARRNVPAGPVSYSTQAEASRKAGGVEIIDITPFIDALAGENVLALQAFNHEKQSSGFWVTPALYGQYSSGSNLSTPMPLANNLANTNNLNTSIYYGATNPSIDAPLTQTVTGVNGKLAVPLFNGQTYDVYVFSVPDGREISKIPNARQPHMRVDGQRMLVNHEGKGIENVYEFNFVDGTEQQVSDAPQDWHPFYDTWGNRVVYGNAELAVGADGLRHPFIFVQCGILPPHRETEQKCKEIPQFGILVPAGHRGEIWGTHPVWASNDMIVYKGCNSWAGFAACGIYGVPAASTKGFSDGFIPRQLTKDTSDFPSDTQGDLIVFTSHREGNWEAYGMDVNGVNISNLSNSPESNDGLPTISPDGQWVAFVSDRGGPWAVWVVPVLGGQAEKLLDLPETPWGSENLVWTNERISWGP